MNRVAIWIFFPPFTVRISLNQIRLPGRTWMHIATRSRKMFWYYKSLWKRRKRSRTSISFVDQQKGGREWVVTRCVDGCKWCVKVYSAGRIAKCDDTQKLRFQLQSSSSRNAFMINPPPPFFGTCIIPGYSSGLPSSFAIPIQWPMF